MRLHLSLNTSFAPGLSFLSIAILGLTMLNSCILQACEVLRVSGADRTHQVTWPAAILSSTSSVKQTRIEKTKRDSGPELYIRQLTSLHNGADPARRFQFERVAETPCAFDGDSVNDFQKRCLENTSSSASDQSLTTREFITPRKSDRLFEIHLPAPISSPNEYGDFVDRCDALPVVRALSVLDWAIRMGGRDGSSRPDRSVIAVRTLLVSDLGALQAMTPVSMNQSLFKFVHSRFPESTLSGVDRKVSAETSGEWSLCHFRVGPKVAFGLRDRTSIGQMVFDRGRVA